MYHQKKGKPLHKYPCIIICKTLTAGRLADRCIIESVSSRCASNLTHSCLGICCVKCIVLKRWLTFSCWRIPIVISTSMSLTRFFTFLKYFISIIYFRSYRTNWYILYRLRISIKAWCFSNCRKITSPLCCSLIAIFSPLYTLFSDIYTQTIGFTYLVIFKEETGDIQSYTHIVSSPYHPGGIHIQQYKI